jgi:hypothetical protein
LAAITCSAASRSGAVFDEQQDVQSLQQHGIHVQEVDGEYPGSLSVQELPPGRAQCGHVGDDPLTGQAAHGE